MRPYRGLSLVVDVGCVLGGREHITLDNAYQDLLPAGECGARAHRAPRPYGRTWRPSGGLGSLFGELVRRVCRGECRDRVFGGEVAGGERVEVHLAMGNH